MKRFALFILALCLLAATPTFLPAAESVGLILGPDSSGKTLAVQTVSSGTPAALSGLNPGDIILEVDGIAAHGQAPQEVLGWIEEKVNSGRSSLITYRRGTWKAAAWIRPLRLSEAQKGTLLFARNFRDVHNEAKEAWAGISNAFNETMKGPAERELFLSSAHAWREDLRRLEYTANHMSIRRALPVI